MKKPVGADGDASWERMAVDMIWNNLVRADMTYLDLEKALLRIGVYDRQKLISAKMLRGKISAAFLLQCLTAIGLQTIDLREDAEWREVTKKPKPGRPAASRD